MDKREEKIPKIYD